jgi:uncharacterized membrane protein YheB (UPF0754 family)
MSWAVASKFILPPLIGAVIGYFTNLIAVKMLFFPHEEKHIFGFRVPFTPGAIPKGKARLAKAAGEIVVNDLFTKEDISSRMLTEEVEKPLIDRAMAILGEDIRNTGAILVGGKEKYDELELNFTELLSYKIGEAIKSMDLQNVIKAEGIKLLNKHVAGSTLLSIVVSDKMIDRIMRSVADKMEEFIDGRGADMIADITSSRIHDLGNRTALHVLEQAGYSEEVVREKLVTAYRESVVNAVNSALKRIDVASIVENKINSMSVEELEKGVLQVMKTELDMIVRLGALIGFVIGSINIFI